MPHKEEKTCRGRPGAEGSSVSSRENLPSVNPAAECVECGCMYEDTHAEVARLEEENCLLRADKERLRLALADVAMTPHDQGPDGRIAKATVALGYVREYRGAVEFP